MITNNAPKTAQTRRPTLANLTRPAGYCDSCRAPLHASELERHHLNGRDYTVCVDLAACKVRHARGKAIGAHMGPPRRPAAPLPEARAELVTRIGTWITGPLARDRQTFEYYIGNVRCRTSKFAAPDDIEPHDNRDIVRALIVPAATGETLNWVHELVNLSTTPEAIDRSEHNGRRNRIPLELPPEPEELTEWHVIRGVVMKATPTGVEITDEKASSFFRYALFAPEADLDIAETGDTAMIHVVDGLIIRLRILHKAEPLPPRLRQALGIPAEILAENGDIVLKEDLESDAAALAERIQRQKDEEDDREFAALAFGGAKQA